MALYRTIREDYEKIIRTRQPKGEDPTQIRNTVGPVRKNEK